MSSEQKFRPSAADKCRKLLAVDLFCGSGAVSSGLKSENFSVLIALDNDPVARMTYELNHPEVEFIPEDIKKITREDAYRVANRLLPKGQLDLLVICAPCQPFSNQNRKRAQGDDRADLVLEAVKFVAAFEPKVVFIENVPGITSHGPVEKLSRFLLEHGYYLSTPRKLDAADLGVPQRRERCIMIASQAEEVAKTFGSNISHLPRKNVFSAIGHLPALESGQISPDDPLHAARRHQPITLERLRHIPQDGGSRHSLPPELRLKCHENWDDNSFPDVYGRMKWGDVAPTLTTGCSDVTKGRFAHPRDDRAITLREAALLQSFPEDYQFFGNSGQIARQIGNAVPVGMVRALSPYLKAAINWVDSAR